jgi:hypothetical protein
MKTKEQVISEHTESFLSGNREDRENVKDWILAESTPNAVALALAIHERLRYGHDRERFIFYMENGTDYDDTGHGYTPPEQP